ncbi:MAG: hypothetical protein LUI87_17700 [Lachnospiraceae bacterium]|nr:hypothetical protein [Lachnospiraceae bacterium]
MINDNYYFRQLTQTEKTLYLALYNGVVKLQKEISVPGISADSDEVDHVYHAITHDCPHLYYFNQSVLNLKKSRVETIFLPQYFCSRAQVAVYNARLETAVNTLIRDLQLARVPESVKVRRVHDYFCQNVTYDQEALCTDDVNRLVSAHSVIGVFARQRAVCEGIAKAVKLLLNAAGMKCIVVSGSSNMGNSTSMRKNSGAMEKSDPHAWNIVKINGEAYHLDVTWDMTTSNREKNEIQYDYYNLTDMRIRRDHEGFFGMPACRAGTEDYFSQNHLDFYSKRELCTYIRRGVEAGQQAFYFRYNGREPIDQIVSDMVDFLQQMELPPRCASEDIPPAGRGCPPARAGRAAQLENAARWGGAQEVFCRRYGTIRLISSQNRTQGTGRVAYEIKSGK